MSKLIGKAALAICATFFLKSLTYAADIQVDISGFAFQPATITVSAGDTITFTNKDSAPHTATAEDGTFTTERLGKGQSETITFSEAGSYPFFCKIHPSMKGTVVVK